MSLFSNRNYLLLWLGQLMAQAANRIYLVVLSWYFVSTRNDPGGLVVLMTVSTLPPVILSVWAGALVDRFNKKVVLVGCDIFSGCVALALAVGLSRPQTSPIFIDACGMALATSTVLFTPALRSLIPAIVGRELIQQAMASISGITFLAQFAGAALGGLLMAKGGAVMAIGVNAAAFFTSAFCESLLRDLPKPPPRRGSFLESMREGLAYARSQKMLLRLLLIFSVCNIFLVPLNVILPVLVNNVMHLGAKVFGVAQACVPAGSLVAALVLALRSRAALAAGVYVGRIQLCMGVSVIALAGVAASRHAGGLFAALCLYGLAVNALNISALSLFAGEIAPDYQGRSFSLVDALAMGTFPIGYLLAGVALGWMPAPSVLVGMAAAVAMLTALCFYGVRTPQPQAAEASSVS
jgi:MFS family permease